MKDCEDDIGGKSLALEESGKPSSTDFRFKAGECLQFLFRLSAGDVELCGIIEDLGNRLMNNIPADALVPQFLSDPAPAEPAESYSARSPLPGKLTIIYITEAIDIGKNSLDGLTGKAFFSQLLLYFGAASRPVCQVAIGGVLGFCQFLFIQISIDHINCMQVEVPAAGWPLYSFRTPFMPAVSQEQGAFAIPH